MAIHKNSLKNLIPAEKGENRNPRGRMKDPPEYKLFKKINHTVMSMKIDEYLGKSYEEVIRIITNKKNPILDLWVGSIMVKGIKTGEPRYFDTIMNRRLGKPKESTMDEQENKEYQKSLKKLTVDELMKLARNGTTD